MWRKWLRYDGEHFAKLTVHNSEYYNDPHMRGKASHFAGFSAVGPKLNLAINDVGLNPMDSLYKGSIAKSIIGHDFTMGLLSDT